MKGIGPSLGIYSTPGSERITLTSPLVGSFKNW